MASPGEMVKRVAEVLGAPEATVTVHDRNLAAAGLRTKGGRGKSAAKMTAGDVANLLLAVAGSSMVKDTVQTVEDFADLPARGGEKSGEVNGKIQHHGNAPDVWELADFPVNSLKKLPSGHTLKDALVALIEAAADGSLSAAIEGLPRKEVQGHKIPNPFRIEVTLFGPYPQATVRIYCNTFSEKHSYSKIPTDMEALTKWSKELEADPQFQGDLKQIREFSSKTLMAMGDLLKG